MCLDGNIIINRLLSTDLTYVLDTLSQLLENPSYGISSQLKSYLLASPSCSEILNIWSRNIYESTTIVKKSCSEVINETMHGETLERSVIIRVLTILSVILEYPKLSNTSHLDDEGNKCVFLYSQRLASTIINQYLVYIYRHLSSASRKIIGCSFRLLSALVNTSTKHAQDILSDFNFALPHIQSIDSLFDKFTEKKVYEISKAQDDQVEILDNHMNINKYNEDFSLVDRIFNIIEVERTNPRIRIQFLRFILSFIKISVYKKKPSEWNNNIIINFMRIKNFGNRIFKNMIFYDQIEDIGAIFIIFFETVLRNSSIATHLKRSFLNMTILNNITYTMINISKSVPVEKQLELVINEEQLIIDSAGADSNKITYSRLEILRIIGSMTEFIACLHAERRSTSESNNLIILWLQTIKPITNPIFSQLVVSVFRRLSILDQIQYLKELQIPFNLENSLRWILTCGFLSYLLLPSEDLELKESFVNHSSYIKDFNRLSAISSKDTDKLETHVSKYIKSRLFSDIKNEKDPKNKVNLTFEDICTWICPPTIQKAILNLAILNTPEKGNIFINIASASIIMIITRRLGLMNTIIETCDISIENSENIDTFEHLRDTKFQLIEDLRYQINYHCIPEMNTMINMLRNIASANAESYESIFSWFLKGLNQYKNQFTLANNDTNEVEDIDDDVFINIRYDKTYSRDLMQGSEADSHRNFNSQEYSEAEQEIHLSISHYILRVIPKMKLLRQNKELCIIDFCPHCIKLKCNSYELHTDISKVYLVYGIMLIIVECIHSILHSVGTDLLLSTGCRFDWTKLLTDSMFTSFWFNDILIKSLEDSQINILINSLVDLILDCFGGKYQLRTKGKWSKPLINFLDHLVDFALLENRKATLSDVIPILRAKHQAIYQMFYSIWVELLYLTNVFDIDIFLWLSCLNNTKDNIKGTTNQVLHIKSFKFVNSMCKYAMNNPLELRGLISGLTQYQLDNKKYSHIEKCSTSENKILDIGFYSICLYLSNKKRQKKYPIFDIPNNYAKCNLSYSEFNFAKNSEKLLNNEDENKYHSNKLDNTIINRFVIPLVKLIIQINGTSDFLHSKYIAVLSEYDEWGNYEEARLKILKKYRKGGQLIKYKFLRHYIEDICSNIILNFSTFSYESCLCIICKLLTTLTLYKPEEACLSIQVILKTFANIKRITYSRINHNYLKLQKEDYSSNLYDQFDIKKVIDNNFKLQDIILAWIEQSWDIDISYELIGFIDLAEYFGLDTNGFIKKVFDLNSKSVVDLLEFLRVRLGSTAESYENGEHNYSPLSPRLLSILETIVNLIPTKKLIKLIRSNLNNITNPEPNYNYSNGLKTFNVSIISYLLKKWSQIKLKYLKIITEIVLSMDTEFEFGDISGYSNRICIYFPLDLFAVNIEHIELSYFILTEFLPLLYRKFYSFRLSVTRFISPYLSYSTKSCNSSENINEPSTPSYMKVCSTSQKVLDMEIKQIVYSIPLALRILCLNDICWTRITPLLEYDFQEDFMDKLIEEFSNLLERYPKLVRVLDCLINQGYTPKYVLSYDNVHEEIRDKKQLLELTQNLEFESRKDSMDNFRPIQIINSRIIFRFIFKLAIKSIKILDNVPIISEYIWISILINFESNTCKFEFSNTSELKKLVEILTTCYNCLLTNFSVLVQTSLKIIEEQKGSSMGVLLNKIPLSELIHKFLILMPCALYTQINPILPILSKLLNRQSDMEAITYILGSNSNNILKLFAIIKEQHTLNNINENEGFHNTSSISARYPISFIEASKYFVNFARILLDNYQVSDEGDLDEILILLELQVILSFLLYISKLYQLQAMDFRFKGLPAFILLKLNRIQSITEKIYKLQFNYFNSIENSGIFRSRFNSMVDIPREFSDDCMIFLSGSFNLFLFVGHILTLEDNCIIKNKNFEPFQESSIFNYLSKIASSRFSANMFSRSSANNSLWRNILIYSALCRARDTKKSDIKPLFMPNFGNSQLSHNELREDNCSIEVNNPLTNEWYHSYISSLKNFIDDRSSLQYFDWLNPSQERLKYTLKSFPYNSKLFNLSFQQSNSYLELDLLQNNYLIYDVGYVVPVIVARFRLAYSIVRERNLRKARELNFKVQINNSVERNNLREFSTVDFSKEYPAGEALKFSKSAGFLEEKDFEIINKSIFGNTIDEGFQWLNDFCQNGSLQILICATSCTDKYLRFIAYNGLSLVLELIEFTFNKVNERKNRLKMRMELEEDYVDTHEENKRNTDDLDEENYMDILGKKKRRKLAKGHNLIRYGFKELPQILALLNAFKGTVSGAIKPVEEQGLKKSREEPQSLSLKINNHIPMVRISSFVTSFLSMSIDVIFLPESSMYKLVNYFLLSRSYIDRFDIPLFFSLFYPESLEESKTFKKFIFDILKCGCSIFKHLEIAKYSLIQQFDGESEQEQDALNRRFVIPLIITSIKCLNQYSYNDYIFTLSNILDILIELSDSGILSKCEVDIVDMPTFLISFYIPDTFRSNSSENVQNPNKWNYAHSIVIQMVNQYSIFDLITHISEKFENSPNSKIQQAIISKLVDLVWHICLSGFINSDYISNTLNPWTLHLKYNSEYNQHLLRFLGGYHNVYCTFYKVFECIKSLKFHRHKLSANSINKLVQCWNLSLYALLYTLNNLFDVENIGIFETMISDFQLLYTDFVK
ncbi:hypothetical protein cand_013060 [Cryptosporidium andersoni]|uniref:URB1 C-terminal domain-containing protein n=1 Tax=Cryptosporidium andersoni TaxID=117008 RepID=A0A1J4MH64_9CRYT|nr:hypothetical protein cand_013060 [Cryptosporidium andersoni]